MHVGKEINSNSTVGSDQAVEELQHGVNADQAAPGKQKRYMIIVRYIIGGVLTYGLLGVCIGWIMSLEWLWIPGVFIGFLGGLYLSYKHELFKD